MGVPVHFSLEVPKRAYELVCELYEQLSDSKKGTKFSQEATFLLSMSMPIIILPVERILKYGQKPTDGYMNNAALNPKFVAAINRAVNLDRKIHEEVSFADLWQYVSRTKKKRESFPNLAVEGLSRAIVTQLDLPEAKECVRKLSTHRFLSILRNALAHGGVLYLDKYGRSYSGAPVYYFAFASTTRLNTSSVELHFLRIKVIDYRTFLKQWVAWLNEKAIDKVLAGDLGLDTPHAETDERSRDAR